MTVVSLQAALDARDRRRRLAEAVDRLDAAIAAGEVTPVKDELRALAAICYEQGLIEEVLRIRRWLVTV